MFIIGCWLQCLTFLPCSHSLLSLLCEQCNAPASATHKCFDPSTRRQEMYKLAKHLLQANYEKGDTIIKQVTRWKEGG